MVVGLAGLPALGACAGRYPVADVPGVPSPDENPGLYRPELEPDYRIGVGDKLLISSYYEPALRQSVDVQPDGQISLALASEAMAAGKTPEELRRQLTDAYDRILPQIDVTVSVEEIASEKVYVGGQVNRPTILPARGEITLLQAVTAAGGFTTAANTAQVLVLRAAEDGRYRVLQQNVDAVLHNKAGELYLRRRDVVYVPKSPVAEADQFVDQYINQIIPRAVGVSLGFQEYQRVNVR